MSRRFACHFVVSAALVGGLAAVACSVARPVAAEEPEEVDLSQFYGFGEMEIFKLEHRSANMVAGDLTGNGLTDLLIADNSHSRLDLLAQRREKPAAAEGGRSRRDVNFLDNGWRFEHRKLPVDQQVVSLRLGDFNGNGRTDIAYFGAPDRLVVRYQPETGDWTESVSFRLGDVPPSAGNLAAGDLNGDGRDDLVVIGKNETYILYQRDDGTLAPPRSLMNTSSRLAQAWIADLDGDGRNDLCYLIEDDPSRAFSARLQGEDGRLGPEMTFELGKPRDFTITNLDGKPGCEIVALDAQTGRAKVVKLDRPEPKPGELAGRLVQYGFGQQGSGRDRDLATGDLTGDGLTDVVVSDPEAAQMIVFRQRKGQGLDLGTPFPGLVGAEQVRIGDLTGDGVGDVVVLSTKERTIGLSRMEDDRLTFPQALPVENEPVVLELADLTGDERPEIVYISREREGRTSKHFLQALRRADDGTWQPHSFGEQEKAPVELRGTPTRLVKLDANRDGRPDFLVFFGLDRAPQLLSLNEQGVPVEVTERGGIRLGEIGEGAVFLGELDDQPSVLVARDNFARNLQLDENQQWRVIDQYNAAESNARIVGVAALDLDGEPGNEIVLVDAGIRKLRVLRRDGEDKVFRPWKEIEIGSFPYRSAQVVDLNGDRRDDLLLFGNGRFAVLYAGQSEPVLKEIASFETKLEETFFAGVAAGDLTGDGHPDVALIDTRSHFIELLHFDPKQGLRHALQFKLFEEKSFGRGGDGGSEPREVLIADVTGDGRPDLVLLAHDRVLIYPQDGE